MLLLGANRLRQGKTDEARTLLERAVAAAPEDAKPRLYLAAAHFADGSRFEALTACRKAVELDSTLCAAQLSLAWMYLETGDQERAREAAEAVVAKRPWDRVARLILAVSWQVGKQYERARIQLLMLERNLPMQPPVRDVDSGLFDLFRGGPFLGAGRQWPTGEKADAQAQIRMMMEAFMANNPARAEAMRKQWFTGLDLEYHLGKLQFRAEELDRMVVWLHSMYLRLQGTPQGKEAAQSYAEIVFYQALARLAAGKELQGRSLLDKLLRADPDHRRALLARAELALKMEEPRQALDDTARLLSSGLRWGKVLLLRGRALIELEMWDEAERALQEAIELAPKHFEYHRALGDLHAARGAQAKARASWARSLALEPAQVDLRKQLARR